jgi:hypothetical protein
MRKRYKHSNSVSPPPDTRQIPAVERRPGVSFQFSPENSRANSPGRYVRARFSMAVLIEDMAGLGSAKCKFNFVPGSTAPAIKIE